MNWFTKYRSFLSVGVALLLSFVFLLPIGLKLKHSIDFHSETTACNYSKTHLHAASSHNDLLDYYFQSLVNTVPNFTEITPVNITPQKFNEYSFLFILKTNTVHGLRAPPFVISI